ncbi:hypothetical protein LG329_02755 [Virgibacillus necropolis]|uniref:hypothetical protein n=1 Tax=Virgibacillus necropolis TaxID=163877 RepID=UPI00384CACB6
MDAIFETIFGNILIILAIVGGIAGFIKDQKNKGSKSTKPYSTPKPTRTPSGGGHQANNEGVSTEQTYSTSMREQLDSTTHRAIEHGEHDALSNSNLGTPSKSSNNNQMKKQIKGNLSKQGLVSGIIMSEVLGPPRAKKPYRSVLTDRRR